MNQEPIDATRVALRTLRLLDDGRRAVEKQWRDWTARSKADEPPADRRQPPEIW